MVDTAGNRVIPLQYADIGLMESGVIPVKRKNKWGYIKRSMASVVDFKYDQAWEFHGGYAKVEAGGRYGLVDSLGSEVIKPKFTALGDMTNGVLIATNERGTGVVDRTGKVLIPLEFDSATPADKGLMKVTKGNKFAYIRLADAGMLWKEDGFGEDSAD